MAALAGRPQIKIYKYGQLSNQNGGNRDIHKKEKPYIEGFSLLVAAE